MKFTFVAAFAFMFVLSSVGGVLEKTKSSNPQENKADRKPQTSKSEPQEASIAIRWDGPKKMFCGSQVFRIGDKRVCLVMGE